MNVDIHAHVLTERAMARLRAYSAEQAPRLLQRTAEHAVLEMGEFRYRPLPAGAWDLDRRLADMDRTGVDVQALSVVPFLFRYDLDPELGGSFARILNEDIAAIVRERPDRFVGLATLPLQDGERAAAELRWAMRENGFRGASLGTNVRGRNLDDLALEPLWAAAQELGAFLFVHPERVVAAERLSRYYLINLLGNPIDTSIAIASLVFGGVLERYPRLVFCFAHGGGFVPYQRGRLVHGWRLRPEPGERIVRSPEEGLRKIYFDTIVHSPAALVYLVQVSGSDRVLLGSDYPFDMGPSRPVADVEEALAELDGAERLRILGQTAAELLGIAAGARVHDELVGRSSP